MEGYLKCLCKVKVKKQNIISVLSSQRSKALKNIFPYIIECRRKSLSYYKNHKTHRWNWCNMTLRMSAAVYLYYIHPSQNNFQSQRFFNAVTNCCEDAMKILMSMALGSHV